MSAGSLRGGSAVLVTFRLTAIATAGDGLVHALSPPPTDQRPSTLIHRDRLLRRLRTRHRRLAALPPAPTPPSALGLPPALHCAPPSQPLRSRLMRESPGLRPARCCPLNRRGAFGCSLSLRRSRIRSQRSLSPVGCLIIAPTPAGDPAARAPRSLRASRYCSPSLRSTLR